jgi:hypothetical protein
VLQLVLAIHRVRGGGRRKGPREVPDHSQAHPYAPPISPSRPLLQHSMPGVPAMLMSILSASPVPAALNHRTEIYRPSRDDNGHRCPSTRCKYSNFTSGALPFCINRLLFTLPIIRHCGSIISYSSTSPNALASSRPAGNTTSPNLPFLPVWTSVGVPRSLCHSIS